VTAANDSANKKRAVLGTAQVLGGNAHEGRCDNVLSGEISVAALQKMMLQMRNVKHVKPLPLLSLTYCHINRFHGVALRQRRESGRREGMKRGERGYLDVSCPHRC
jgi:hypothetical protein